LLVTDAVAPLSPTAVADARDQLAVTDHDIIISWNTFADSNHSARTTVSASRVVHLGDLLHDREESLQRRLLAWLGELADLHTSRGAPLPFLYPNLHAWWLLSLTEKNYATTPQFTTLLKLMLLHDIATDAGITTLDYHGENRDLEAVLHDVAHANEWTSNARPVRFVRRLRRRSEMLQALVHLSGMLGLAISNLTRRASNAEPSLVLVGYLIPAANPTRSQSPYWGDLAKHLPDECHTLWLYHRSDEVTLTDARAHCRHATTRKSLHRTIDEYVTFSVWWRTLITYRAFAHARRSLALPARTVALGATVLPVSELFADQMRDSLAGSRAVWSIAHCHTYDAIVRARPKANWLYLWENKPFEHALTSAVQRHSSGRSVGYAHSVVRRRDHRYFEEANVVVRNGPRRRPAASLYAVNGSLPHRNLREVAQPSAPVVEVEALRYSSLATARRERPTRLLVLGDIAELESLRLLDITQAALISETKKVQSRLDAWFKPHPGSPSQASLAAQRGFAVTQEHLGSLAPTLALAVVGVAGAASIDLTLLGVPTATVLDAGSSNLSPLAGVTGACFVRTAGELSDFISAPRLHDLPVADFVHRDDPPRRWLQLLDSLT
jgi:surface carbohydrate biosynthesis protein (TIGR04326 family)